MPTAHTFHLARLGHALGGPTWLVLRPDGVIAVRLAFDKAEIAAPASALDEEIGRLSGQRLVVTGAKSYRSLAYRAVDEDGERVWGYGGEREGAAPVWNLL